ncbi:aminotransferase class IV [bacterium]|nr:aminotransferase class IV [bacterium]
MKLVTSIVDGKPNTHVSVQNRGLRYGDGLFETIAIVGGHYPLLDRHITRLLDGLESLKIILSKHFLDQTLAALEPFISQLSGVCRLSVTRGGHSRGYAPSHDGPPQVIAELYQGDVSRVGNAIVHSCDIRLAHQPELSGLKTMSALAYVQASMEREGTRCNEGFLFDEANHLIEATARNVFVVTQKGLVITPSLRRSGVAGIMRDYVIEYLRIKNIDVVVGEIGRDKLSQASEVFLTNSVTGIWPVVSWYDAPKQTQPTVAWPIGALTTNVRRAVNTDIFLMPEPIL